MAYKETPTWMMPFGSMMNSYGLINEGMGKSAEEFIKDVEKIAAEAMKLSGEQPAKNFFDFQVKEK